LPLIFTKEGFLAVKVQVNEWNGIENLGTHLREKLEVGTGDIHYPWGNMDYSLMKILLTLSRIEMQLVFFHAQCLKPNSLLHTGLH
jgi:hypothetical protein